LPDGVTAKDLILADHRKIGTGGGQGYVVEYRGSAIEKLSMEGADDDLQHVDRVGREGRHDRARRDDLRLPQGQRPHAPQGADWDAAVEALAHAAHRRGRDLRQGGRIDATKMTPFVTWGTNPGQGVALGRRARPRADSRTRSSAPHGRAALSTWA
jgi:3-isopropylmalate/(R)-2-methylmalate dehydratase large subunit